MVVPQPYTSASAAPAPHTIAARDSTRSGRCRRKEQALDATVRRYEGVTDPKEAARHVDEGFLPIISQVPGIVAYYWVDAGDGVMVSTSVLKDQTGVEESNRRAADYVRENMASLLPNPPQITAGDVVATKQGAGARV